MASPRLIRLTERVPRVVRLHRADVEFLLTEHRGRIEVMPTGPGRYRLTALGVAGLLATPHARIAIRPKLAPANLWQLLCPMHPPLDEPAASTPVTGDGIVQLLAGRFATLLTERAAAGLHRDYVERSDVGPYLRGRLDTAEQARDAVGRRDQLHSRFDDFTADIPCNRLPRAVAESLISRSDVGERTRSALIAALGAFDGVASARLTPELCSRSGASARRAGGYWPLLNLSFLIARGLFPGMNGGEAPGATFLLDLETAWEGYVTAAATQMLSCSHDRALCLQPYLPASPTAAGQPDLHMRPDLLVVTTGEPRQLKMVLDAKWKRLPDAALPTDDVYQVLAYAAGLGVPRAALVFPGNRNRCWTYPTAGPRLDVVTLRITGPVERCEAARRRFGRWLAREV